MLRPVVVWLKFTVAVGSKALSALLPNASVGDAAQPGTHQTLPEVRLAEDIHDTGDAGSLHVGTMTPLLLLNAFCASATDRQDRI